MVPNIYMYNGTHLHSVDTIEPWKVSRVYRGVLFQGLKSTQPWYMCTYTCTCSLVINVCSWAIKVTDYIFTATCIYIAIHTYEVVSVV